MSSSSSSWFKLSTQSSPSSWSKGQQMFIAFLPKISSSLSIIGSTWIIIELVTTYYRSKRKAKRQQQQQDQKQQVQQQSKNSPNNQDSSSSSSSSTHYLNVYQRLMLMTSLFDFITSCSHFTSTWPIPKRGSNEDDEDGIAWNIGNTTTCNIQGFIIQLSIATPM